MLTATTARQATFLGQRAPRVSGRAAPRRRVPFSLPQAGLILVPTGDGSCRHLEKEVALPSQISLTDGLFELGREAPADIVIALPTISSRHAMIRVEGKRVNVTDLNSTNGTYLGTEELVPMKARDISVGSEIIFGDMFLAKFELREDSKS